MFRRWCRACSLFRRLEATNRLQLAIGLPLRNQDALDKLLQDIYDRRVPIFASI